MPRIKTLLTDVRVKKVIDNENLNLGEWLESYIGSDNKESLTIIDLSLLPSEVTGIITAVIARMVFEAQQRYLKLNKQCLPTVLVMEEAHYFIKRYNDDAENIGPATQCCKVFEKIAREGRKFGLGLFYHLKDHLSYLQLYCLNVILFYYIAYPMTEIRNWLAVCCQIT